LPSLGYGLEFARDKVVRDSGYVWRAEVERSGEGLG